MRSKIFGGEGVAGFGDVLTRGKKIIIFKGYHNQCID